MQYDQYYGDRRGARPDYSQMGGMAHGEYFQGGAGPSGEGAAGDSSGWSAFFVPFGDQNTARHRFFFNFKGT